MAVPATVDPTANGIATSAVATTAPAVATASVSVLLPSPVPVQASVPAPSTVQITGARLEGPRLSIRVQNAGALAIDLSDWKLQVGAATFDVPRGTRINPSTSTVLHTGGSSGTGIDVILGRALAGGTEEIRPGDKIALVSGSGWTVASASVPAPVRTEVQSKAPTTAQVDPRQIALLPEELPAGFVLDDDTTTMEVVLISLEGTLPDATAHSEPSTAESRPAGVRYETELVREAIGDGPGQGRIVIGQTITRLDGYLNPADLLAESRDALIRDEGFAAILEPPEDDETVRLVKRTVSDTIFSVGTVKGQMVVFTSVRGVEPAIDLEFVTRLSIRTTTKYELLAAAPPERDDADGRLRGRVLVRPVCPGIEREGPDCEPHPTMATVTILLGNGDVTTRFVTSDDGLFDVALVPGHYVVRLEVAQPFAVAQEQEIDIAPGQVAEVSAIIASR